MREERREVSTIRPQVHTSDVQGQRRFKLFKDYIHELLKQNYFIFFAMLDGATYLAEKTRVSFVDSLLIFEKT